MMVTMARKLKGNYEAYVYFTNSVFINFIYCCFDNDANIVNE